MTYVHYESPVAQVVIDAYAFPREMAETALMYGWAGYYTGVSHCIQSLISYHRIVYEGEWSPPVNPTDRVMNFAARHVCFGTPSKTLGERQVERAKELADQVLDLLEFFKDVGNVNS